MWKKKKSKEKYSDPYIPTQSILTMTVEASLAPGGGPNSHEDTVAYPGITKKGGTSPRGAAPAHCRRGAVCQNTSLYALVATAACRESFVT